MRFRHLAVLTLGALALAGCEQGYQTVVENRSSTPFVAYVEDHPEDRYYAVTPGATVVVDDRGHNNPAASAITLLDLACQVVAPVAGNFWNGGVITIDEQGSVSFRADRPLPMGPRFLAGDDPWTAAVGSCELAASRL